MMLGLIRFDLQATTRLTLRDHHVVRCVRTVPGVLLLERYALCICVDVLEWHTFVYAMSADAFWRQMATHVKNVMTVR